MKNRISGILFACIITAAVLAGCGSSSASSTDMKREDAASASYIDDYAEAEEAMSDDVYGNSAVAAKSSGAEDAGDVPTDEQIQSNSNRKLIKTVDMSVETREFDKLIANVTERINSLGGYTESSNIQGNAYDSYSARSAS